MTQFDSSDFHKPFERLESLLEKCRAPLLCPESETSRKKTETKEPSLQPQARDDDALFRDAMADVTPILRANVAEKPPNTAPIPGIPSVSKNEDENIILELKNLVRNGDGFVVSKTPEYMEGANYNVHPEISKRLHKGQYSMQAYVDLHGLMVAEAEKTFNLFLKNSILSGKRALLIIHGRGLSSPQKPVLKLKVYEWLTQSFWRKWVIAFSSARACDGGAGATYVLLRKSPLTKRLRKRKVSEI